MTSGYAGVPGVVETREALGETTLVVDPARLVEACTVLRDDHGFILTGPDLRNICGWTLDRPPHHLETSVPGVFATGDVRSTSAKRVAAAVGEGSMAVMLVHRYLAES